MAEAAARAEQVVLTSANPEHVPAGLSPVARYRVAAGKLSPA